MKKILISFIVMFLFIPSVFASVNVKNRTDFENYGVNKKWNITESNKNNVLNTYLVDADEKIYDFSDVLTDEEEKILYDKIMEFYEKTGIEIILLTDNVFYTNDTQNENYAADFYDYNDFGINNENYSGILLFRNTYEVDPYYDMYTFGDAQLYFNSQRYDEILDSIYNDLHNKNYLSGFSMFIDLVKAKYDLGVPKDMHHYYIDDIGRIKKNYQVPYLFMIIISSIVTIIIMLILKSKNKGIIKARTAFSYVTNIQFKNKKDTFINSAVVKHYIPRSDGSSSGSFHSSSGSSGSFHSSGGGRHG